MARATKRMVMVEIRGTETHCGKKRRGGDFWDDYGVCVYFPTVRSSERDLKHDKDGNHLRCHQCIAAEKRAKGER